MSALVLKAARSTTWELASIIAPLHIASWPWETFSSADELGVPDLEGVPIMVAHLHHEEAKLLIVSGPDMKDSIRR